MPAPVDRLTFFKTEREVFQGRIPTARTILRAETKTFTRGTSSIEHCRQNRVDQGKQLVAQCTYFPLSFAAVPEFNEVKKCPGIERQNKLGFTSIAEQEASIFLTRLLFVTMSFKKMQHFGIPFLVVSHLFEEHRSGVFMFKDVWWYDIREVLSVGFPLRLLCDGHPNPVSGHLLRRNAAEASDPKGKRNMLHHTGMTRSNDLSDQVIVGSQPGTFDWVQDQSRSS